MAANRTIRKLTDLENSASTSRVLNLLAVYRKNELDPDALKPAFFENRVLARSIIVKHRLRPHETMHFALKRSTVTKILIPIDNTDLRLGARALFVGQDNWGLEAESLFGGDLRPGTRDRAVLDMLDRLPSLDPFLLREQLRRNGYDPARVYFSISDGDIQRMYDFVRGEVLALVTLSSRDERGSYSYASRLVGKLLATTVEAGFEPLKETLKLSSQEYLDGMFSWRGFLYYKWVLKDLEGSLEQVVQEMTKIMPRGARDPEASLYLPEARERLARSIEQVRAAARGILDIYNRAYAALTKEGNPIAFRDFVLSAPQLFIGLGERLGALQHVVSFWRYRFPDNGPRYVSPTELMDLFLDFEDSLAIDAELPAAAA